MLDSYGIELKEYFQFKLTFFSYSGVIFSMKSHFNNHLVKMKMYEEDAFSQVYY